MVITRAVDLQAATDSRIRFVRRKSAEFVAEFRPPKSANKIRIFE